MNYVSRQPLLVALLSLAAFSLYIGFTADVGAAAVPCLPTDTPLGTPIGRFETACPGWSRTIVILCLVVCGFVLGRKTVRCNLYAVNSCLPLPLYPLAAGLLLPGGGTLAPVAALSLLAMAVYSLYNSFRYGSFTFGAIFRAAIYIGILPLIDPATLPLLMLLPLAALLFKRSLRELIVAAAGAVLPFAACSYLHWAFGGSLLTPALQIGESFAHGRTADFGRFPELTWIIWGVTALLLIAAIALYYRDRHTAGAKSRLILRFDIYLLLLVIGCYLLPGASRATLLPAAVPIAALLPLLFVRLNATLAWSLYLLLLFLSLLNSF